MSSFEFEVFCSAERKVIGSLILPKNLTRGIEPDHIIRGFTPNDQRYSFADRNGIIPGRDGKPIISDGMQVVCPRCFNALLIREPGKPDKGVYLVPGFVGTSGEA